MSEPTTELTFTTGRFKVTKSPFKSPYWLYKIVDLDRPYARENTNPIIFQAVLEYITPCSTAREIADRWEWQTDTEAKRFQQRQNWTGDLLLEYQMNEAIKMGRKAAA